MILVVGASGELGSRVVQRLREGDHPVRCLVRPGTEAPRLREWGADVVRGDLADPASLAVACEGVHTVVASATAIARVLAGSKHPSIHEADELGMASLVEAAENAGVERFVYVSYAGADADLGTPLERAKTATERRLARSPIRRVVVRPDAFQDIHLAPIGRFDIHDGKVSVFGKGDTKRRWVATDDVAALVAAVAVEVDPPDTITFGGPEAISRNEAIAVAEQATGKKMKVQRMPRAVARLGMRLLDRPSPAMATILGTGLMQDLLSVTWDDGPLRERGITPRSASDWIREQARTAG
ncbi:NAD(P)H-binding protein [Janibacter terrae]|uniref:NAD(P)H-binding protein n=1 Tax=Janibacter terrae TaxID=103817 RepID=A0ABZ2FDT5_9MICO